MYDHHHHHNNNSPPLPASLVSNLPQSHLESTLNTHHIIVSLSSPLLLQMGGRGVEDIPMPTSSTCLWDPPIHVQCRPAPLLLLLHARVSIVCHEESQGEEKEKIQGERVLGLM
ncbi:unnamed protein product [Musa acuminata var. zebrina]